MVIQFQFQVVADLRDHFAGKRIRRVEKFSALNADGRQFTCSERATGEGGRPAGGTFSQQNDQLRLKLA